MSQEACANETKKGLKTLIELELYREKRCRICFQSDESIVVGCKCQRELGFHNLCFQQFMQSKMSHRKAEPNKRHEGSWSYKCEICGQRIKFKCEEQLSCSEIKCKHFFLPMLLIILCLGLMVLALVKEIFQLAAFFILCTCISFCFCAQNIREHTTKTIAHVKIRPFMIFS